MRCTMTLRWVAAVVVGAAGLLAGAAPAQWDWMGQSMFAPLDWPRADRVRAADGAPGPDYWQQRVDYRIDAALDEAERTITGRARITYHNNSPRALTYLWVHLEQNMFRSDSRGSRAALDHAQVAPAEETLGCQVRAMRAGGRDLTYLVDDTRARVDLPRPISPGSTFEFEIEWSFRISRPRGERMGIDETPAAGPIYELAQWFPCVATYDDVRGWNALPYLGQGEFYTNFGNYDVRLTVPRDHIVVATGELQNPREVLTPAQRERLASALAGDAVVTVRSAEEASAGAGRPDGEGALTWRFKAENVRTFAWASSRAFMWDAVGAPVVDESGRSRRVLCQSVYPPEALPDWAESTAFVRHAVGFYSGFVHPYPYPTMTNVFGAEYGMEYPMIIFCGRTSSRNELFWLIDHEVAHTWFPMLVNTDERRHAWMDEGFNSFVNYYSQRAYLGDEGVELDMSDVALRMGGEEPMHPMVTAADQIPDAQYGFLAYEKPAAALVLLREQVLGPARFDAAFREYVRRWAYKSPQPADFFRTMEDASGEDLAWFWRGWFYGTGSFDVGIDDVQIRGNRATMHMTNYGEIVMPLDYAVVYADGTEQRGRIPVEAWQKGESHLLVPLPSGRSPIAAVVLDPDSVLPDVDPSDNEWDARAAENSGAGQRASRGDGELRLTDAIEMPRGGARSLEPGERAFGPRGADSVFTRPNLPPPTEARLGSGAPGPEYWQQRCDYQIEATLDDKAREIRGRATITYHNNSPHELPYIWLNLEQNLFRRGSLGELRTPPGARFGNRDRFEGGLTLWWARVDGRPVDVHVFDTLGRIDLAQPLKPRTGRLTLEIEWSFPIPPYGSDRMGIEEVERGTIFQLAQWFPCVVKYDDYFGWNALPYLGQGEFYTDFGTYDVRLTVPRSHIVVATGELVNEPEVFTPEQRERLARARSSAETVVIRSADEVGDPSSRPTGEGPLTWRFKAEDVRTFAWASSDAFILDAAYLDDSGPAGADGAPRGTLVQSAYPNEAQERWSESTEMLRFAIEGYNHRWFRYPYPTAINVNGIVGGMEYPMIIFCRNRSDERGLFGVTTHEIGHNWFPMIVNTDERRHAWMDEGFNTFINYYSVRERYPDHAGGRGDARRFAERMPSLNGQPMEVPADQVESLGAMQYEKPAVALVLLREQILGPERFDAAFRAYIERWAFKSPRPADFFRTMEDVAGADLSWFWRGWFLESGLLDQAVGGVEYVLDGQTVDFSPAATLRVTIDNLGELVMPVVYRVEFDDGSTLERRLPVESWFKSNRVRDLVPLDGRRVSRVVIDPEGVMPDVEPKNNEWSLDE